MELLVDIIGVQVVVPVEDKLELLIGFAWTFKLKPRLANELVIEVSSVLLF